MNPSLPASERNTRMPSTSWAINLTRSTRPSRSKTSPYLSMFCQVTPSSVAMSLSHLTSGGSAFNEWEFYRVEKERQQMKAELAEAGSQLESASRQKVNRISVTNQLPHSILLGLKKKELKPVLNLMSRWLILIIWSTRRYLKAAHVSCCSWVVGSTRCHCLNVSIWSCFTSSLSIFRQESRHFARRNIICYMDLCRSRLRCRMALAPFSLSLSLYLSHSLSLSLSNTRGYM